MANKSLFKSLVGRLLPNMDLVNEAGGAAYALSPEHALAQLAVTGCLGSTYYASDTNQLGRVLELASKVDVHVLARTAVYARESGFMKDVPALLLAVLSMRDPALFAKVFPRVIDNAKMLRTFVQIMRSGQVGRKSLGTRPKKQILGWLESASDDEVFRASVGADPSLADVVKMVHPKPATDSRRALYAYLVGRKHEEAQLPALVQRFESYKRAPDGDTPDVPFQMLTALPLGVDGWVGIAKRASWQMTRMNLATFARHGVFDVPGMPELIAARLSDPRAIAKSRVFPYQLLVAYLATKGSALPRVVVDALHDALELATGNVPALAGKVWVLPDVSGSMQSPVTGHRAGATTAARCVDVAAMISATVLRRNPSAKVLPFDTEVRQVELEPRDSIMTNAARLAISGGGTNVAAPLRWLNAHRQEADLVILVSDNQSWVHSAHLGQASTTIVEWEQLRRRSPKAKLVCIDLQPYAHTQAPDRDDILNVGGFSDDVFRVITSFAEAQSGPGAHWLEAVRKVQLA